MACLLAVIALFASLYCKLQVVPLALLALLILPFTFGFRTAAVLASSKASNLQVIGMVAIGFVPRNQDNLIKKIAAVTTGIQLLVAVMLWITFNATDGSLLKCVESFRLIFVEMLSSNFVASEEFSLFIDLIHVLSLGVLLTGSAPYTTTSSTRPVI